MNGNPKDIVQENPINQVRDTARETETDTEPETEPDTKNTDTDTAIKNTAREAEPEAENNQGGIFDILLCYWLYSVCNFAWN